MEYEIRLTPLALSLLEKIKDRREQKALRQGIEKLKLEPEKQGKALSGKLRGYRSVRAVGQRDRIIYRVDRKRIVVVIVGVGRRQDGSRRDIYSILEKLLEDDDN